jgi:hypothetical protein
MQSLLCNHTSETLKQLAHIELHAQHAKGYAALVDGSVIAQLETFYERLNGARMKSEAGNETERMVLELGKDSMRLEAVG